MFDSTLIVLSSLLLDDLNQFAFGMFNDCGTDIENVFGDIR